MMAIALESVSKRYGDRVGVHDLSLRIAAGEVFGYIGPNGAGKTTTIRMLLGLLRPEGGSARVLSRDCWAEGPAVRREIGYMPGDLRLYPWMTAQVALHIFSRVRRTDLAPAGRGLCEYFGLDPSVAVRAMSRGMRQKLGLILALAHDPRVLVLDEPTSGLDPITQERLYQQLRERAGRGHTVFFSSHVLSEVEGLCDRVAIVRAGEIVEDEAITALRERAHRVATIRWAGAPPAPGSLPPGITLEQSSDRQWECRLVGPAGGLLAWLRPHDVADLEIGPPDLDRLFRQYYRAGGAAR